MRTHRREWFTSRKIKDLLNIQPRLGSPTSHRGTALVSLEFMHCFLESRRGRTVLIILLRFANLTMRAIRPACAGAWYIRPQLRKRAGDRMSSKPIGSGYFALVFGII